MQFETREINSYTRALDVTLEADDLREVEKEIVRRVRRDAEIPGFRKGRAPLPIIKKRYADVIQGEMLDGAISHYYRKVLDESGLEPVAQGNITDIKYESVEDGMAFTVELQVEPEIELKKTKGLKVDREKADVTDDMVTAALEDIQRHFATVKQAEKVEKGHKVVFSMQELDESDLPIVGNKFDDMSVEVGSGEFDELFEEQMIGMTLEDEKVLRKKNEENDQMENYRVKLQKIEEWELPALDDDLVKNLGEEDMETLDQLKERLKTNIADNLKSRSQRQFVDRLIDEALKENPFDAPEAMIENYMEHQIKELRERYKDMQVSDDDLKKQVRPEAVNAVRWYLLKRRIVESEKIDVTMEKVHERIEGLTEDESQRKMFLENKQLVDRLRDEMLDGEVVKFLEENADITEVEPVEKS